MKELRKNHKNRSYTCAHVVQLAWPIIKKAKYVWVHVAGLERLIIVFNKRMTCGSLVLKNKIDNTSFIITDDVSSTGMISSYLSQVGSFDQKTYFQLLFTRKHLKHLKKYIFNLNKLISNFKSISNQLKT
jgi:hypothetical protein